MAEDIKDDTASERRDSSVRGEGDVEPELAKLDDSASVKSSSSLDGGQSDAGKEPTATVELSEDAQILKEELDKIIVAPPTITLYVYLGLFMHLSSINNK